MLGGRDLPRDLVPATDAAGVPPRDAPQLRLASLAGETLKLFGLGAGGVRVRGFATLTAFADGRR